MKLINRQALDKFKNKHPQSRKPLVVWESLVSQTDYADLVDLKKTFAKADYLANGYTVFDIGGNKYRLITIINYSLRIIDIRIVWTHNEYSSPKNKADLKSGKI